MRKFKIFYSWQSDLPGNKTRYLIQKCIDAAIDLAEETEAIEAERDEATLGTTGSPDIVTTLFSKIDDCDLFVADISLCFSDNNGKGKKSPNPNVLLELGYAVKTLSWERIICLCNTDYGNEYPFDIAHNRITNFALIGKDKKVVMNDISTIIFKSIRDIRKLKPRTKSGMATHIIGAYDFVKRVVTENMTSIKIEEREGYLLHNKELLEDAKILFSEIQKISTQISVANADEGPNTKVLDEQNSEQVDAIDNLAMMFKGTENPIVWKDIEEDTKLINRWLGIDVPSNFFELGNLKQVVKPLNIFNGGPELKGEECEKLKYEKLRALSYKLTLLDMRTDYINTFDGMCFVPLAIQNMSAKFDEGIRIVVNVDCGEIIEPNENLIWSEFQGLQGCFCRDDDENDIGIIGELFLLEEDGNIHMEENPYNNVMDLPRVPMITASGLSYPQKEEKDYALELQEFIASSNGNGYYEFVVDNLRPGECKWLCTGMLIRPLEGKIKISYQIHSAYSMGDLQGNLEMRV